MVYLTPDADDVIEDIYPNKIYIIGAIVDPVEIHNLSLNRARKYGIETRRFPLLKGYNYIQLSINDVMQILTRYMESRVWKTAIEEALADKIKKK